MKTVEWIFYLFLVLVIGMAVGVAIRDCNPIEPVEIPATYKIETLHKVDTETTGEFFLRINEAINQYDEKYIMHAFIPIFDVDSPTVVGAITTYRRK